MEKDGFIKYFHEDCVEWLTNELLGKDGYIKICFENKIEIILDTVPKSYDQSTCCLCEKEFKLEDVKERPVNKDQCHLTGKFGGLAQNNCILNTRKALTSFVPILFHNFSEYDCHLLFEKLVNMVCEEVIKIKDKIS